MIGVRQPAESERPGRIGAESSQSRALSADTLTAGGGWNIGSPPWVGRPRFAADGPRAENPVRRAPQAAGTRIATAVAILLETIFTGLAKWARGAHFL